MTQGERLFRGGIMRREAFFRGGFTQGEGSRKYRIIQGEPLFTSENQHPQK